MIDFLYTSETAASKRLLEALRRYRPDASEAEELRSGDWGTLVVCGNAYPGFEPVETAEDILIVLGGPLPRRDESVACDAPDDGTRWIFDRWVDRKSIKWDEDLVGHFLALHVHKRERETRLATDISAFVPAYISGGPSLVVGSHVDAVAIATGSPQIDYASVVDFLAFKTVTHPYTMYTRVRQLPAASEICVRPDRSCATTSYWQPREPEETASSFAEKATELRQIIVNNVSRICSRQPRVSVLLSGGADSRIVASLACKTTEVDAVTFQETFNRQAKVAKRVAERLGIQWRLCARTASHYCEHARDSVRLCESLGFFVHAHANGIDHKLCKDIRVVGGLMADALCKGKRVQGFSAGILLVPKPNKWRFASRDYLKLGFPASILSECEQRRHERNRHLRHLRPASWAEWHWLWPATTNAAFTFLRSNRRLFPIYEPFADAHVVKWSASVPQRWKINKRIFSFSMKPILKETWYIRHGGGTYPYFGPRVNLPLQLSLTVARRLRDMPQLRHFFRGSVNQRDWPVWHNLVATDRFRVLLTEALGCVASETLSPLSLVSGEPFGSAVLSTLKPMDQMAGLHAALWLAELHRDPQFPVFTGEVTTGLGHGGGTSE